MSQTNPNDSYMPPEYISRDIKHHSDQYYISNLEVVPGDAYKGSGLHRVSSKGSFDAPNVVIDRTPPMYDPPEDKKARICGIKRKTFFIILAIAIGVIIGAGIGGGVAAAMSKKDASPQQANLDPLNTGASRVNADGIAEPSSTTPATPTATGSADSPADEDSPAEETPKDSTSEDEPKDEEEEESSNESSSSSKSATPTTIGPSFKTIEVVSPTKTLYRDCPDSDNTIKEITLDDNTPTMRFRKKCRTDFDKPKGRTKGFVVNTKLLNLDDCINQCAMWNRNNREDIMNGLKDKCNVVCWRSTFESDWPAQCFGWQSVNSTNSNNEWDFSSYDSSQCDGAGWIDEWEI